MTPETTPALILKDVTVSYDRVPAVHHVSVTFDPGTLTAIAGPNGAGKSTLLKAVMRLLPMTSGTISHGALKPRDLAYIPQASELDRSFPITVGDLVMLGAYRRMGAFGGVPHDLRAKASAALDAAGLSGVPEVPIGRLSMGQFQRALFARLMLRDAPIVLLDEPFAGVDAATTEDLMAVIAQWHRQGRSVIAVLHDLKEIETHFPNTLLIARECVAFGPTATVLTPDNLERARQLTDEWAAEAGRRLKRQASVRPAAEAPA